ncbi:hypothetical protein AXF42_Ash020519 [Apostasia shenzhenica]|uniref:Uncharacterized protein n=1 Tax=Apostasia shenzhenica TaxID=1088818 RepID=A0A2I0BCR3_9ASPA|nr:hypothetical protein AXF42_Ash020519 [Apostasia shenzhenica]
MLESRVRHLETVETSLASTKIPEGEKSRAEADNASVKLDEQIEESDSELLQSSLKEQALARPPDRVSANAIEDVGSMEQLRQIELMGLDDSRISEDVVSVPLDDVIQELQQSSVKIEPETAVPLSDAPLIGAPFRLLSFVARFVSGADLVNQDKTTA